MEGIRMDEVLGIDREAERAAAEIADGVGLGPPLSGVGRTLEPIDVREEVERVAQTLHALHHAHAHVRHTFSPFRAGERYRAFTLERGGRLPDASAGAVAAARRIEDALPPFKPALCHNNLLPEHVLDDGEQLWLVNWDYAGMGDPFFDLGNLSAMNDFELSDDTRLVEAYLGHCSDPDLARLRLHRAAAQYCEGMWGVVQQVLPEADRDYGDYAAQWLAEMLGSDWEQWLDD